ncbi:transglycosylase SLT domain-containing protein [Paraburkholderia sp. A3RO-2L]|uniref:transglycosylase SLT domain-containing protein n=1 Tax=unclassified Paraburkholderia TaxID=2615204 RepID=UPI0032FDCC73|nr:lytic transglycosylase domain-containing protein [Burkholderia vietnamiensis]
MNFPVTNCFARSQKAFAFAGLTLSAGLLVLFMSIVQHWRPIILLDPAELKPTEATAPEEPQRPNESVEERKRAITLYLSEKYKVKRWLVRSYVDIAWHESAKHPGVEPELLLAVMQRESSLCPVVSNSYGAVGLMQVVRRWHTEKLGARESLRDPRVNIRVGAQILEQYIKEKGRLEPALVKYSGDAPGYAAFVLEARKTLKSL